MTPERAAYAAKRLEALLALIESPDTPRKKRESSVTALTRWVRMLQAAGFDVAARHTAHARQKGTRRDL